MDRPGAGGAGTTEVDDDIENDPNPEDQNPQFKPEGDADPKAGGEGAPAGEGGEGDPEGAGEGEGEGGGLDPRDETIAELKARLEKLEKPAAPAQPEYKEPTEEEWQKHEEETGMSRLAIKFQARQMANLYNRIMSGINSKFGKFEKENTITSLAKQKGFEDANRFRKGMEEFLADYDESMHSNEKLLKNAYFYAKGKGTGAAVRQAANSTERNRHIAGSGRPASPNAGGRGIPVQLTSQQRGLAKKAGMSDKEYFDLLPKRRK